MEIEIANTDKRLKPGMYARVSLTVEERKDTLVAPKTAVVDFENKRGVWMPNEDNRAKFVPVQLGIEDAERVEITSGLKEGDQIVTTGATAVRNNDLLVIAGAAAPGGPGGGGGAPAARRSGRSAAGAQAGQRARPAATARPRRADAGGHAAASVGSGGRHLGAAAIQRLHEFANATSVAQSRPL